ncbi:MAG TPA: D-2-hydroxyacid dehydrogenase [Methylomirabilota bacterium]|nr:D-2-hydroxyacid dehydrogenase [Methylomirabilota bacterium]
MTAHAPVRPRIIILDGHTLNPGDLSWEPLQALGECVLYDRTSPDQIVPRLAGAALAITNKVPFSRETIEALPALRYIGVTATGYNIIDVVAARERGLVVSNVPSYGTKSVAQHTLALLLELTQHVGHHAQSVREGRWSRHADWCYWDHPLVELDGLTLGVVGWGRIGQAVGRLAEALGMKVVTARSSSGRSRAGGPVELDLDELFRTSDVVSLHCPLTPQTRHLVNAHRLALMKPTAFLLNTSRGPLVDEPALAEALNRGVLAGAGLDVLATEPPPADNPLLTARNCLITPHQAWASRAARSRLMQATVANVEAFLAGRPKNVVT